LFIAKQDRIDYRRITWAAAHLQLAIRSNDWRSALTILRDFVPEFTPGAHLQLPQPVVEALALPVNGKQSEPSPEPAHAAESELVASPASAQ